MMGVRGLMVLVVIWWYMVIEGDMMGIKGYKKRVEGRVGELEESVVEKEEVIEGRKKMIVGVRDELGGGVGCMRRYGELVWREREVWKWRE